MTRSRPDLAWLLASLHADGGMRTAIGFGRVTPGRREDDPRDEFSVCGWADKAFRYWTEQVVGGEELRIENYRGWTALGCGWNIVRL